MKAEIVRLSLFVGAISNGDFVKSTLDLRGMNKILYLLGRNAGQVEITNDVATILKAVSDDNTAAKILVDDLVKQKTVIKSSKIKSDFEIPIDSKNDPTENINERALTKNILIYRVIFSVENNTISSLSRTPRLCVNFA